MEQKRINAIRDKAVASSSRCSCEDILIKSGMSYRRRGNQLYLFCPNCDRDQFLIDRAEKVSPRMIGHLLGGRFPIIVRSTFGRTSIFVLHVLPKKRTAELFLPEEVPQSYTA